jgi:predicted component of type VI protein secretion system
MRASLVPLDDGPAVEIVKDVTLLGRNEVCDVRIDDPSVSKVHLLIAKTDGVLLFRDIASTNGTKVNGQRVLRGALLPEDKLQVAAAKFRVKVYVDEAASTKSDPEEMTPASGEGPAVQVFRAQELAQPGVSGVREPEPDRGTHSPSDSRGPHFKPEASSGGPAPQFVD